MVEAKLGGQEVGAVRCAGPCRVMLLVPLAASAACLHQVSDAQNLLGNSTAVPGQYVWLWFAFSVQEGRHHVPCGQPPAGLAAAARLRAATYAR